MRRCRVVVVSIVAACASPPAPQCPAPARAIEGPSHDLVHDGDEQPRDLFALELTITSESGGRIRLHAAQRADKPSVAFDVPVRPDHVDWFDPSARRLVTPTPQLMWSAWRLDTSGLLHDGRPGVTLLQHVVVGGGAVFDAIYDLGAAVGAGMRFAWCTRAWIVDAGQAIASNVVCTRT